MVVESADTAVIDEVLEVPAEDQVRAGHCGRCDMKCIAKGCFPADPGVDVGIGQRSCLITEIDQFYRSWRKVEPDSLDHIR